MSQVYLQKDGLTIQASTRDYFKKLRKRGWQVLSPATPLFSMANTEQIRLDIDDLKAQQANLF